MENDSESPEKQNARLELVRKIYGPDYGKVRCDSCGFLFEESEVIIGSDPCASVIGGNDAEATLCLPCYKESADEI